MAVNKLNYIFSFYLKSFLVVSFVLYSFAIYPQNHSMPVYKSFPSSALAKRFKLIEGEILFAISKAKKRRNVPLGTIASVEEVCELFDHPIFNNINLGSEQELHPHEQVKFNQKLLEVPIDSIIDQFQSMVPFFTANEISINKISTPGNMEVNDFDIGTLEALNPQTDNETRKHMYYGLGLDLKWPGHPENPYIGGSCLPRIVHENLSNPANGTIDWQARNKYKQYSSIIHPSHVTISPANSCVMCIFFIKELHAALKVRFDEILKSEAILKDKLIKQATDLGIQLKPLNQIPNDQSFFLKEQIEIELRIEELATFIDDNKSAYGNYNFDSMSLEELEAEAYRIYYTILEDAEEKRKAAEAEEKRRLTAFIDDGHKDAYGFRNPNYNFSSMSIEELEAEADRIGDAMEEKRKATEAEEKRKKEINTIYLYIDLLVVLILILPLIYMHRTLKLGVKDRFFSALSSGVASDEEELEELINEEQEEELLEEDEQQAIQAIKESAKTKTTATYGPVPSNLATAICRMAYCIAAVDGQITNNEWEAIKEGLSFVALGTNTFNDAVEDLDSFDMDQLNSELHSLSAFLRDNADDETKDRVHEFLMDIASSDHYFEGAKQDWITIIWDEYWFPED